MKIVCINNGCGWEKVLTIGKSYEVIYIYMKGYTIINDKGDRDWFEKFRFISLSEYRNEIIEKLLK